MLNNLSEQPQKIKYCSKKVYHFIKKFSPKSVKDFKKPILFLGQRCQKFDDFEKLNLSEKFSIFLDKCPKCDVISKKHFHCLQMPFIFFFNKKCKNF